MPRYTMDYFNLQHVMAEMLGIPSEETDTLLDEGSVEISDRFKNKYGVDLDTFEHLLIDLLKLVPVQQEKYGDDVVYDVHKLVGKDGMSLVTAGRTELLEHDRYVIYPKVLLNHNSLEISKIDGMYIGTFTGVTGKGAKLNFDKLEGVKGDTDEQRIDNALSFWEADRDNTKITIE